MRSTLASIAVLLFCSIASAQDLLIVNARIIDGADGLIENGSILVRDGRIESVTTQRPDAAGVLRINVRGMTAMPGMINTHWHLLSGSRDGTEAGLDRFIDDVVAALLESLLQRGVTTIMSAGDAFPKIIELREQLASGERRGPRLLAVGPVFTAPGDWPTQLCGDNAACKRQHTAEVSSPDDARARVAELANGGVDAIKLVHDQSIVPDVRIDDQVVAAITDEARRHDLIVHAHVSTPDEVALELVDLGVRAFVHPVSLMEPEHADGAAMLRDLGIPVTTTATAFPGALAMVRHLWEEGVTIAFGTDSTTRDPISTAETRFVEEAEALTRVLTNMEVLNTLTGNAAVYLGLGDELGTLAPGKIADIVVLGDDPLADIGALTDVRLVVQSGAVIVDRVNE